MVAPQLSDEFPLLLALSISDVFLNTEFREAKLFGGRTNGKGQLVGVAVDIISRHAEHTSRFINQQKAVFSPILTARVRRHSYKEPTQQDRLQARHLC